MLQKQLDVHIADSRVAFDERGAPYTLYELRCDAGASTTWAVERRFTDFKRLSSRLAERHHALPELPREILSAGWLSDGPLSPEFVKKRAAGLQAWLRALLLALPDDDELLLDFIADASARRVHQACARRAAAPAASTVVASPDDLLVAARCARSQTRPSLQWELLWEAPEEADTEVVDAEIAEAGRAGDAALEAMANEAEAAATGL